MQQSAAARRPRATIVPSRYMQQQTKASDDKENSANTASLHAASRPAKAIPDTAAPSTTPHTGTSATILVKPAVVRTSRAVLAPLPVSASNGSRIKQPAAAPSPPTSAAPVQQSVAAVNKPTAPPPGARRRTHDIADHPPASVASHRSSFSIGTPALSSVPLPPAARPQLSDLSLHCYHAALLQSHYLHAAAERAHNERWEAAERQLGAVAAVIRGRLSEERQCKERIARIRQSEADHYSLAAQHAAIAPLLPAIQQAAAAYDDMCDIADTLKAQLRLDGLAIDRDELTAELVAAQGELSDIAELLQHEGGAPSLASSLSLLSPSLSSLLALLTECVPELRDVNDSVATLQCAVERQSSAAFVQMARSSEAERRRRRQEAGGQWQW